MAKLRTIALAAALTLGACSDAPTISDASSDGDPPVALPFVDSSDEPTTATSEAAEATISTSVPQRSVQFLETVFGPWELSSDLEHAVLDAFTNSGHVLTSDTIFVSLRGTPQYSDAGSTSAFSAWADAEEGAVLAEFIQTIQLEYSTSAEEDQSIEVRNIELINVGQLDGKCSLNTLTPLPSFFECDVD